MLQSEIPITHWVLSDPPSHKVRQPSNNPLQGGGDTSIIGHYQGQRAQRSCTSSWPKPLPSTVVALIPLPQLIPMVPVEAGYLMTSDGTESPSLFSHGLAQHVHPSQDGPS